MKQQLKLPANSPMLDKDFIYGVATASFQIEGGIEHRLPCIWDTFCATPGKIADHSNGAVACNHYQLWQQDIDLIESLGVDAYRLSISWPRLIDEDGELRREGANYYVNLLKRLQQKGIKAFVTLYHWDLPQYLEDQGGWLNRDTAYQFERYATQVAQLFGTLVHSYATLNEPFCSAYLGYEAGIHAPGKTGQANGRKAAHHLLLAHGLALQALQQHAPHAMNGIVLNFTPCYSASEDPKDQEATAFADGYHNDWYLRPIMEGKYPDVIEQLDASCRPDILEGDMATIAQPLDFLGVNFYTRAIYRADEQQPFVQLPPPQPLTDIGWEIYPSALTDLLVGMNKTYTLPPIYITENGAAIDDQVNAGKVADSRRIDYYQRHLNAVNDAMVQGVNVNGYFAWSLMDNFEWAEGYSKRFGIVYVDYSSQTRTLKDSAIAYRQLITTRY
ncbi:GH1 family beta-glucosidase [Paraferrimonas haliotis]|uniref:Beta-glucosidase n=1 Tax=Paraferrimonas haliotis TaxID=2013866 RepID=A0AA37WWH5_9GAMM|nr:GH1 family beta-glucosidase [Paraferrimonas haliotis]GLS83522.1 beta-glucosidase [Paraferrimonas haliotis]